MLLHISIVTYSEMHRNYYNHLKEVLYYHYALCQFVDLTQLIRIFYQNIDENIYNFENIHLI